MILWAILLTNLLHAEEICFSENDAKSILVDLERGKNLEEQIKLYEQMNGELVIQIEKLKEINRLALEQLEISKNTIISYKDLTKLQDDVCKQQIKDAKPSFMNRVITYTGTFGIGVVVSLLFVILL